MTESLINQSTVRASVSSEGSVNVTLVAEPATVVLSNAVGVSDHGDLTGLGDDDHPQYLTGARGDARYGALGHSHVIADVSGLSSALVGKLDANPAAIRSTSTASDAVLEVSGDGVSWVEALRIARATGAATVKTLLQWAGNTLSGFILWRFQPSTTGDPTAPRFNASVRSVDFSNGPVGLTNYKDHTFSLGWNFLGGDREDNSQSGFGLTWESKFYAATLGGNVWAHEFHLQGVDANGVAFRPFGVFIPTQQRSGTIATFNTDLWNINADNGGARIAMVLNGANPVVNIANNTRLFFSTNNSQIIQQINSTGNGFLALPYIDNFNRVAFGAPAFINATTADGEYGAVLPINVSALAANKAIIYAQANTVTGDIRAISFESLSATGRVLAAIGNTRANGHAIVEASTTTGTGNPLVAFSAADATKNYSAGVYQPDGSFRISAGWRRVGGASGSEDRVIVNDNSVEVKRGLKLPSYAVAGLPSASTAGAGTLVYVSNGSGGPTLACSNGTNWKVVAALGATVS